MRDKCVDLHPSVCHRHDRGGSIHFRSYIYSGEEVGDQSIDLLPVHFACFPADSMDHTDSEPLVVVLPLRGRRPLGA